MSNNSVDTGGVVIGKIYKDVKNKPIVRIVFDTYSKNGTNVDTNILQNICYDFGIYYSIHEIKLSIRNIMSKSNVLNYEEFMVWWRTEDKLR